MEHLEILNKYLNDEYVGSIDLKKAIKEVLAQNGNITRELLKRDKKYEELLKEHSEWYNYIESGGVEH